jgi:predicted nucleotidyltransferase component of viral defense system
MLLEKLPPATATLLQLMAQHCAPLSRFALIGGTALTLHLGHRISEDLDFSFPAPQLDARAIVAMLDTLRALGVTCIDTMPAAEREKSFDEGFDLDESQRNFTAVGGPLGEGRVKLTFVIHGMFRRDIEYLKAVMPDCMPMGHVRVATVPIIFDSKCAALGDRLKSRDLFDLWWLTHRYTPAYSVEDIVKTVQRFRDKRYEETRARLVSYSLSATDEGFEALVHEPITLASIRDDFRKACDALELQEISAQLTAPELRPDDSPSP